MKPNRKYFQLSYHKAMKVAMEVASVSGVTDWKVYRDWTKRYEDAQARRRKRELVFGEQLTLL